MSDDRKLKVVLCWHMHQPDYRGPEQGEFQLPWVYLHAIKDYIDMACHLEQTPDARAVVNFAPVLLEQLEDYALQVSNWLENGTRIRDPLLAALAGPGLPMDHASRWQLVKSCQRANEKHLVNRFRTFHRLIQISQLVDQHDESLMYLNDQYLADLLVWYHLAWMGEYARTNDIRVETLEKKRIGFNPDDRRVLVHAIGDLVGSTIDRYRKLAETGRVELSVTPYAHPIVPLLLDLQSAREAMPDVQLPNATAYPGGEARTLAYSKRPRGVQASFWLRTQGLLAVRRRGQQRDAAAARGGGFSLGCQRTAGVAQQPHRCQRRSSAAGELGAQTLSTG